MVREHWLSAASGVQHLPVGFGAHHWVARAEDQPALFVTFDGLGPRHTAATLEGTYAAAAALCESGLEFVVPCLASGLGGFTVPLADGALSTTRWIEGWRPPGASAALGLVERLHATTPPRPVVEWRPLVPPSLADDLAARVTTTWSSGPMAEPARQAVAEHLDAIAGWTASYDRLTEVARTRTWVPTHGEPHERNLLQTTSAVFLVDWESLRLAPPERDLRILEPATGDPEMLEMFDLEWRLDEIAQFAAWFEAPHTGTEDDRIALGGLLHELQRS